MPINLINGAQIANGEIVDADDLKDNFNQIINLLNGTSADKEAIIKLSHGTLAALTVNQQGAGPIFDCQDNGVTVFRVDSNGDVIFFRTNTWFFLENGSGNFVIGESGTSLAITIENTTGLVTFEEIPVGPNADPTLDNQLARRKFITDRTVSFSVGWSIPDPSTANLNSREFGSWIVPAGGTYTITQAKVMFRTGSHAAGGSLVFIIDQFGVGTISSSGLNDTNNTVATVYPDNFANFTAAENQIFSCFLTSRSGTINERDVMVVLEGFRTLI